MYDANYNQNNLIKPEWLDALIIQKRDSNIVPIGVLNYTFNVLDPQAVQKNLIYLGTDSLLHDVTGRTQVPYYKREIYLASPLLNKVRQGTVTFQFPSYMLLQNNTVTITSLFIDFGAGQTATLSPGGSASILLDQSGTKIFKMTASFSNGSQKVIRATMEVEGSPIGSLYKKSEAYGTMGKDPEPIQPCVPETFLTADMPFSDYITSENKKGVIEIGYYFANCTSQQLQKPIIILDGFDPGDERKIPQIYDLLYYNNGSNNFGEEMRQQGYDVIIVNFPNIIDKHFGPYPGLLIPVIRDGGADYIERNALALVKLIQSVNQQLVANGSAEELIVVGPSMGGLISRYALAYMEKKHAEGVPNMNHNTRLWVSFDSPHWGANIPIGDQYWLEYYTRVAGNKGAKASLENKIGSVAARQMLVHHWTAGSESPVPNVFRSQFMLNLQSNGISSSRGFPQNLRKVALANGSGIGILQPDGVACGKVLKMDAVIRNWIFAVLPISSAIIRHKVSESNIYFTSDYGSRCKVFDGWYKVGRWGKKPYEEKFAKSPALSKSYDRVPGGKFNTQGVMKEEGQETSWVGGLIHGQNFTSMVNNHSFIPTVSSLGLTNPSVRDWAENLSTRNLVCTGETPFDDYFTPGINEEHVFLSVKNVNWLTEEIEKGQPNCPTICSYSITGGDSRLCLDNTYTYTLDEAVPAGATTVWEPSSNLQILSFTYNSVTVKALSNGTASLTAIINNPCGAGITLKKQGITLGTEKPGPIDWTWDLPPRRVSLQVDPISGATSYQWYLNGTLKATTSESVYRMPMAGNVSCGNYYYFGVRAVSSCGTSDESYVYAEMPPCYFGYKISPNPAGDYINIEPINHDDKSGNKTAAAIHTIEIYDKMGVMRLRKKLSTLQATAKISVASLANDVYNLRIYDGQSWQSYKIIVQH